MISETITFRHLSETDLLLLHNWFQKLHVKEWYARDVHYTPDMIREKYLPRILDSKSIPNFIIYADDIPIGYIQLYYLKHNLPDGVNDYNHRLFTNHNAEKIAGIDFFIAETDYLNKGYASLALKNFIDEHIIGQFSVVISDPLKKNSNAIHFLERNGFKKFVPNSSHSINELMVLPLPECRPVVALSWITGILEKLSIHYQIAGGLAAKAYGSSRPLNDIDIDIPEEDFDKIHDQISSFITYGPARYKSDDWDLLLMILNYEGQIIDISGAYTTKIRDHKTNTWVKIPTDFSKVNKLDIFGLKLPVINYQELIAYKKILSRPVDLIDIEEIKNFGKLKGVQ